ncbi:MAG: 3-deoxy-D-manno-octulosonic acid transferase [Syntrophorhabdus sp. PtaU1.Bin002]|nr:MAG: 3-deoxy-D-manno-octulosonic acid transferase [Syntrophorhabdus sp. PtaU1.Bin002]
MWKIGYNILVNLVLPVFILYSLTQKKIRKNLLERFFVTTRDTNTRDTVWIHAASVGEAVIAENLISYMRQHTDLRRFLVTTNTYYAKDLLRTRLGKDVQVFSLPFDLAYTVNRFMADSTFKALIIVETEIWPNLIWKARKRKIPIIIVNGRISDSTIKAYSKFSPFLRHVFADVDRVVAQSEEHMERFVSIGMDPEKTITTGNIKYYRTLQAKDDPASKGNILTFGSIKEKELPIVLPVICDLKTSFPDTLMFVVPRDLHLTTTIEKELSRSFNVMRYSVFRKKTDARVDIVVVDTVGDLVNLYGISKAAFVGGSLAPYGGQNILEPLLFGIPVLFGPYMENFRDVADLVLQKKAGIMVSTGEELGDAIRKIMGDEELRRRMGNAGRLIIDNQSKVMAKTVNAIMETIAERSERRTPQR